MAQRHQYFFARILPANPLIRKGRQSELRRGRRKDEGGVPDRTEGMKEKCIVFARRLRTAYNDLP
jgi:hypothetical protein